MKVMGDHPRSRGVYILYAWYVFPDKGSSPLARGLLGPTGSRRRFRGIIPARAGFTRTAASNQRPCSDHPRSRGVYLKVSERAKSIRGSSPLARGLPPRADRDEPRNGIIPARAGFTVRRLCRVRVGRGSSPLARGLPSHRQPLRCRRRIIPARAGFTAW